MAPILRTLGLLALLLIPAAGAQDALESSVTLVQPWTHYENLPLDGYPWAESECDEHREEWIYLPNSHGGYRFTEGESEIGCARLILHGTIPEHGNSVIVEFVANREVARNAALGSLPNPLFHQAVGIRAAGEPLQVEALFQPDEEDVGNQAITLARSGLAPGPIEVHFEFGDMARTARSPEEIPNHQTACVADIQRPRLLIPDIPVPATQVEQTTLETGESWSYGLQVPDNAETLDIRLPLGHQLEWVMGPSGSQPAFILDRTTITIQDPEPGNYTIQTFLGLPPPVVSTPLLPWTVALGTLFFIAGAGYSTYRFGRFSHATQRVRLRWSYVSLGGFAAIWATGVAILALTGGQPLHQIPLSLTGIGWAVAAVLLCLACSFQIFETVQQARRGQHLRHEAELQEYITKLARSNRDLEEFAYVASHDLQAPLRRIRGFLELLQRRHAPALDPEAQDFVKRSVENSEHLQELIRDLLAFARLDQRMGTRARLAIADAVHAALDEHLEGLEGAKVDCQVPPEIQVVGSYPLLRELFSNLIDNAVRYRDPERRLSLTIHGKVQGNMVVLEVRDNGRGITESAQGRVFELFSRADVRTSGTGIGLASCRKIVELHNGTVGLGASSKAGSTFEVMLPLAPERAQTDAGPTGVARPSRPTPTTS